VRDKSSQSDSMAANFSGRVISLHGSVVMGEPYSANSRLRASIPVMSGLVGAFDLFRRRQVQRTK
jgi:hypothetical protein